jgi:hypothetical protein
MKQHSDALIREAAEAWFEYAEVCGERNFLREQNEAHEAEIERLRDENRILRGQLMQLQQDKEIGEVLESE